MNNLSDSHAAIYEEPVDERIRKFLKLENYFLKIKYHKELDTSYDSFAALYNLIMIYKTLSRVEVISHRTCFLVILYDDVTICFD